MTLIYPLGFKLPIFPEDYESLPIQLDALELFTQVQNTFKHKTVWFQLPLSPFFFLKLKLTERTNGNQLQTGKLDSKLEVSFSEKHGRIRQEQLFFTNLIQHLKSKVDETLQNYSVVLYSRSVLVHLFPFHCVFITCKSHTHIQAALER